MGVLYFDLFGYFGVPGSAVEGPRKNLLLSLVVDVVTPNDVETLSHNLSDGEETSTPCGSHKTK